MKELVSLSMSVAEKSDKSRKFEGHLNNNPEVSKFLLAGG
jgi:hypothetical protein